MENNVVLLACLILIFSSLFSSNTIAQVNFVEKKKNEKIEKITSLQKQNMYQTKVYRLSTFIQHTTLSMIDPYKVIKIYKFLPQSLIF